MDFDIEIKLRSKIVTFDQIILAKSFISLSKLK